MGKTSAARLSPPKDTKFRRRAFFVRHLLKKAFLISRKHSLCDLGEKSTGCNWQFCADHLGPDSIVYSAGVGRDITFEHALVKRFGCSIVMVDPSPTGVATMARPENKISNFRFFAVGLGGRCGVMHLTPPIFPGEDSWFSGENVPGTIEVPCLDLSSLMKQNQHQHIDLLKLDIEGAEYEVLEQILRQRIPVRQLLVEFHDGILPGVPLS